MIFLVLSYVKKPASLVMCNFIPLLFHIIIVTFKDGKPTDLELDDLAGKVAPVWKPLGIHLGISSDVLDVKDVNAKDKPSEMLHWWRDNTSSDQPYCELYNAMCHSRVGRSNLAKEFCCKATT